MSSCLELVSSGHLTVSDARDSFQAWGIHEDESANEQMTLLNAMTEKEEASAMPSRSPYGVMHTPLPDGKDQFDFGDLGVLMSIIKGLGLQLPSDDNDTAALAANEKKMDEVLKPDLTEDQILALFSGIFKGGDELGESTEEIERLLENDPLAAAKLLAPLLGDDAELREFLMKNMTEPTAPSEDVAPTGKNGTVLAVAGER